jgi:hypothetical protein
VFDGGAPSNLKAGSVQFAIAFVGDSTGFTGHATWNSDWTFELNGHLGIGGSLRMVTIPDGWFLKVIMLDGRDVTGNPWDLSGGQVVENLQILLTRTYTTISGSVTGDGGAAVRDYVAVLFAEDRTRWTAQSQFIDVGRPDQKGQFSIRGLPAGRYLAAAVDYLEPGGERARSAIRAAFARRWIQTYGRTG